MEFINNQVYKWKPVSIQEKKPVEMLEKRELFEDWKSARSQGNRLYFGSTAGLMGDLEQITQPTCARMSNLPTC